MSTVAIDITNVCNFDCIHCLRDKMESRVNISVDLFKKIIDQIAELGIERVSLTGGEPTLHPNFGELLTYLAEKEVEFNFVTNGWEFKERVLPIFLDRAVKRYLQSICFSIDGASDKTHDVLRGKGSFREVIKAANLCRLKGIPISIKTVVTNINKNEVMEIALLGVSLKATKHHFIALTPTPRAIDEGIIPSSSEMKEIFSFITGTLMPAMKTQINIEGAWGLSPPVVNCNAYLQIYNIDHIGNFLFCCNLSHVRNGDKPYEIGREFLVDLNKESLEKGIAEHYQVLAQFTRDRLKDALGGYSLTRFPCWWCLQYFDKVDWLKNYTDSEFYQLVKEKQNGQYVGNQRIVK
ncbi:MAG: radical SAM protein [Deltaproteobacteria bacterium]|nr:radical SAM protein [Deltaproteobacteria bacterium]